jgi:phosphoribosylaminoimidazole carboxylase PurE protein
VTVEPGRPRSARGGARPAAAEREPVEAPVAPLEAPVEPVVTPDEPPPPAPDPQLEREFEGRDVDAPRVGIVVGERRDVTAMEAAEAELDRRGIRYEVRVMSLDGEADVIADYARNAKMRGLRVIVAGAALSAVLPALVAAHTDLPVIGVPLVAGAPTFGGLDALLSLAQAPPGVPVATVGVGAARNAAVLAARILDA